MLHPALTRALVTAHIEDLHRAAARRRTIRLARRVAHEPPAAATLTAILHSASARLRERRAPQADGTTPTEIPQAARWPSQSLVDVRLGVRAGVDGTSNNELPASLLTLQPYESERSCSEASSSNLSTSAR
jgi:hypothetical protein